MKKITYYLSFILILFFSIFGNPIYQILTYLFCHGFNYGTELDTNVFKMDKPPFLLILMLIFIIRFFIYATIFHFQGKIKPFKNLTRFFIIFIKRHLYQFIGLLTLWIWFLELEFNIVGIFLFPICLILGLVVSIITVVRILKIPKDWERLQTQNRNYKIVK